MSNLSNYKKVQIILLVLIVIALTIFGMSIVKHNNIKNFATEATFSDMTDVAEGEIEDIDVNEEQDTDMNDLDTSWDEEAEETEVTEEEKKDNSFPYYIKINYTANCITVYTKDSSGNYTVPYKAIICSTGIATPRSGVYKMSQKYRWHQLNGGVYGQYCSRITGHILFHSVPYSKASPDSLKYVAYDKLGTKASAGCIRLTTADAIWIYNNCPSGTMVEFYGSSNPGPLGKPSAKKIASNVQCRNWDPTDPDSRNPWRTYKEPAPAPSTNQSSGSSKSETNNAPTGGSTAGSNGNSNPPSAVEPNKGNENSGEVNQNNTTGGNTGAGSGEEKEPDNETQGGNTLAGSNSSKEDYDNSQGNSNSNI